jgi:hypothetical protein
MADTSQLRLNDNPVPERAVNCGEEVMTVGAALLDHLIVI